MSRRQPSLPGFPDIPDPIEVRIPANMPWEQIGGDVDPGTHGGTIATADGDHIELLKIQPVREYVGDKDAAEVGFPFWTKEAWFDLSDLDPKNEEVKSALDSIGMSLDTLEADFTPEERAIVIAEALLDYGHGDEGPAGWSKDLPDYDVKWQTGKGRGLRDYLADEDDEFRQDVLGWGDIQSALEETVQKMVDQSAATGWSHVDDQTADDLESEGFDPESIVAVAEFGDAVASNEDIQIEKTYAGIEAELEQEGYEMTDKGGEIPSAEGYAYAEHVIRAVAKEMDVDQDVVTEAAEALDWWQEEIPGSTSGYASIWAKKKTGGAEERRPHARRRR